RGARDDLASEIAGGAEGERHVVAALLLERGTQLLDDVGEARRREQQQLVGDGRPGGAQHAGSAEGKSDRTAAHGGLAPLPRADNASNPVTVRRGPATWTSRRSQNGGSG